MIKKFLLILIIPQFIIINVFLEFLINNLEVLDSVLLVDLLKTYLFSIIIILILIYLSKFFFKENLINLSISISIFGYFIFYHFFLKNFISKYFSTITNYDGEISLLLIILFFILILKIIKFQKIRSTIIIFYITLFVFNSLTIITKITKITNFNKSYKAQETFQFNFFSKEEIQKVKSIQKKPNIYYVILDSMVSLTDFSNKFDFSKKRKEQFINNLNSNDLFYLEGSKSNFPTSYLTISSIFNLSPIVDQNSPPYINRSEFYPIILDGDKKKPNLINHLDEIGYNFKLIGPLWGNCRYNKLYCLSYDNFNNKNNLDIYYIENPNNFEIKDIFYKLTPFAGIETQIKKKFLKDESYFQQEYENNDTLGKFLKMHKYYETKNKPHFYFIHHLSPHWPYVYDKNCNERMDDSHLDNDLLGYKLAYLCVLNKIDMFMKYIKKIDPTSIVVVQANHGRSLSNKDINKDGYENLEERLSIFNAIKINKKCIKKLSNINMIRQVLSCPFGVNDKLIDEKIYVGFYENQLNYGKIYLYENYK